MPVAYLVDSGSIQSIDSIPLDIRRVFKTVWDIDPSVLVQMAADRGPFVCQSQSLSLYFTSPTVNAVVSGVHYLVFRGRSRGVSVQVAVPGLVFWPQDRALLPSNQARGYACPHHATSSVLEEQ